MNRHLAPCALLSLLALPLSAQGSITYFGQNSCGPGLQIAGSPTIGSTVFVTGPGTFQIERRIQPAFLAIGASTQQYGGMPLPIALATMFPSTNGVSCGNLLQSAEIVGLMPQVPLHDQTSTQPIPIPLDPQLVGLTVYCQIVRVMACVGFCAPGYQPWAIGTNAATVTIG